MNNMNMPPQLIKMLRAGNPQKVALNLLKSKAPNNEMLQNVLNMVNAGNTSGVETICKNVLRSKGLDPDGVMQQFQNQINTTDKGI